MPLLKIDNKLIHIIRHGTNSMSISPRGVPFIVKDETKFKDDKIYKYKKNNEIYRR